MWLVSALRLIGARDALQRLERAWQQGTLDLRGVPNTIPETREFVEIPSSEAGRLRLVVSGSGTRLVRGGRRWRVTDYHDLQARTVHVERLAREVKGAPAPAPKQASESATLAANAPNLSQAEFSRKGGKESGLKRREGRKWVRHATELAEAEYLRNPAASFAGIAREIWAGWKLEDVTCPAQKTLERFVSERRRPRSGSGGTRSGSGG
jgi:hypothetical protein